MSTNKSFLSDLPPWSKGVLVVTIAGVAAFALWKTYGYFQKKAEDEKQKAVGDASKGVVNDLMKKGQKLSFPEANYQSTANTIKNLLDGCETIMTEVQTVEEIIKVVKKPIDWYHLISVFGNRDIADCGTGGFGHTNYDLVSLLKEQLDSRLYGESVNGKRYFNDLTLVPLTEYLKKMGVSI